MADLWCPSVGCERSELHDAQVNLQRKTNETVELVTRVQQLQSEKDRLRDDYEKRLAHVADQLQQAQREIEDRDLRLDQVQAACQEVRPPPLRQR